MFEETGHLSSTDYENGRQRPYFESLNFDEGELSDDTDIIDGNSAICSQRSDVSNVSSLEPGRSPVPSIHSRKTINSPPSLLPTVSSDSSASRDNTERNQMPLFSASATSTSNLNFSTCARSAIDKLWTDVERKLNTSLSTHDGLVRLILHQQLMLSKQGSQISLLEKEVRELRRNANYEMNSLEDIHSAPFGPVNTFQEYVDLSTQLKTDVSFFEKSVSNTPLLFFC